MEQPLISIIVPVYNAENYLFECLKSIEQQSFTKWECIIINDGSTDNSKSIISQFVLKDSRFKSFEQQNSGVSSARNKGISLAEGEYIHFVDADDYLFSETESTLYKTAKDTHLDIVFMDYVHLKDKTFSYIHDVELKECVNNPMYFQSMTHTPYEHLKIGKNIIRKGGFYSTVWRMLIKRRIITENSVFFDNHTKIGEDRDFVAKLTRCKCRMGYINKCLYVYRFVNNSAVHRLSDHGEPRISETASEYWMKAHDLYSNKYTPISKLPKHLQKTAMKGLRFHYVDSTISLAGRGDILNEFYKLNRLPDFNNWFSYDYILHKSGIKNKVFLGLCKLEAYKLIKILQKS